MNDELRIDEKFMPYVVSKRTYLNYKKNRWWVSYKLRFPNDYGAAISKGSAKLCLNEELWELDPMKWLDDKWSMPIPPLDESRFLSDSEINELLEKLMNGQVCE